jgi:hypothetical protein
MIAASGVASGGAGQCLQRKTGGAKRRPTRNQPMPRIFAVDSGAKPILLSATMKTALILVVGKRVGKAV